MEPLYLCGWAGKGSGYLRLDADNRAPYQNQLGLPDLSPLPPASTGGCLVGAAPTSSLRNHTATADLPSPSPGSVTCNLSQTPDETGRPGCFQTGRPGCIWGKGGAGWPQN